MSHIMVCKTKFTDLETARQALVRLGIPAETIQVSTTENALMMRAYNGEYIKASLVVNKSVYNGYGDIGLQQKGNDFSLYLDDMDNFGRLANFIHTNSEAKLPNGLRFDERFGQMYAACASLQALQAQGLFPVLEVEGEDLRIVADC